MLPGDSKEMNERIRQLAGQAQVGSAEFGNGISYFVSTEETFNKFAELIVKECADFADEHNDAAEGVTLGVGKAIKQHFGVEP
jgi:hypothetical protein